jgi:hypothetical protein
MADTTTPEQVRTEARSQLLAVSRAVTAVAAWQRQLKELALFRDVEASEGNSSSGAR